MKTSLRTDRKKTDITLVVEDEKTKRSVRFRVTKTGPWIVSEGLPNAVLRTLLDRFERFVAGVEKAEERMRELERLAKSSRQIETFLNKLPA